MGSPKVFARRERQLSRSAGSDYGGRKSCLEQAEVEGTFFSHFKNCLPTPPARRQCYDAARVDGGRREKDL